MWLLDVIRNEHLSFIVAGLNEDNRRHCYFILCLIAQVNVCVRLLFVCCVRLLFCFVRKAFLNQTNVTLSLSKKAFLTFSRHGAATHRRHGSQFQILFVLDV
jgi:hypothetical protein